MSVCPACLADHEPGRARIDRRTGGWAECWEMTEGAWALVKDREAPRAAKGWARGLLGLTEQMERAA